MLRVRVLVVRRGPSNRTSMESKRPMNPEWAYDLYTSNRTSMESKPPYSLGR